MKSLSELLLEKKYVHFMKDLEIELSEYISNKKLIRLIDQLYINPMIHSSFKMLEGTHKFSKKIVDAMIDDWMTSSGLEQYIFEHYRDNWEVIHDTVKESVNEELLNAHYSFHHPKNSKTS